MCGNSRLNIKSSVGTTIAAISLLLSQSADAQVAESGYSLPLSLAVEAATEAIRSCEGQGYAVSASVVDTSGVQIPKPAFRRRSLSTGGAQSCSP